MCFPTFRFNMLLRIILSEDDIRKVTIDNLPETVDDFHSIMKTKLGLKGDLIEAEFARLTSFDLKGSLFSGLDQHLTRFLELYKVKSGTVGLTRLTRLLDDDSSTCKKRSALLLGLPHYLKEDPLCLFKTVEPSVVKRLVPEPAVLLGVGPVVWEVYCSAMNQREMQVKNRACAVALTDSAHNIWLQETSKGTQDWMQQGLSVFSSDNYCVVDMDTRRDLFGPPADSIRSPCHQLNAAFCVHYS
ncbi:Protein FAM172A [Liparis tanakae]|uniref:Protein FAM172A n=1 Tax=Liparis tanakae TaxID=230148 RepID=A0A4Z2F9Z6_9TELE|nr:Protein FAM172A [Liparis tanakae]